MDTCAYVLFCKWSGLLSLPVYHFLVALYPLFNSSKEREASPAEEMVRCHKETRVLQYISVHLKT